MNKFSKITKKLINNPLWCNQITYIPRIKVVDGVSYTYQEQQSIELKVVITQIDKNLIDNTNILPTDLSFVVAKLDLSNPTIDDYIIYNEKKYKIVQINEIGVLNNESVGYTLIIRLA